MASLKTKIKTEIEYRDQASKVQTGSDLAEPVQTRADTSEHVRTRPDPSAAENGYSQSQTTTNDRPNPSEQARIRELESQNQLLKIDVAWREKMLEKITAENEKGQESLHAQARYIGHLESDLLRLGGKPDEKFLSAPVLKTGEPSEPEPAPFDEPEVVQTQRSHPNQQTFYSGHSG